MIMLSTGYRAQQEHRLTQRLTRQRAKACPVIPALTPDPDYWVRLTDRILTALDADIAARGGAR